MLLTRACSRVHPAQRSPKLSTRKPSRGHPANRFAPVVAGIIALVSTGACETVDVVGPRDGDPPALAIVLGREAFTGECASCHAAGDGFDLAFFRFTDTTIVRRALGHVDQRTASNIVTYIRSLETQHVTRDARAFQPGNTVLASDAAFGMALFGADAVPANLTTAAVKAIDPLAVRVAIGMPKWSVETDNLDWMPDRAIPAALLDDQGGNARGALAGYYAAPTIENLTRAVAALRSADRRVANPAAPCIVEDVTRADYAMCFDVRRWTSSLVAQHMLRHGLTRPLASTLHDTWWDVGNAVRKSIQVGKIEMPNASMNWASWMYLGWMFDPGRHASVYTGTGLERVGLVRHATFVAMRSIVARPRGNMAAWADVRSTARFAPSSWSYGATRFVYAHMLERLNDGERPETAERLAEARGHVESAYTMASKKVTAAQKTELLATRDQLLARLQ
jgi:mono/diheme cytochrome c family protein